MGCFCKLNFKHLVFYLMSISMFILIILNEDSFAEELLAKSAMDYSIEHSINATLYNNNQYTEGGKTLTTSGINIDNWNYNKSKYLQVNIMVVAKQDEVHVVEIKFATPFYSVSDVTNVPSGFSRVEGIKNDNISINEGKGTYYVKNGCGTFRYYLKPNIDRATIQLEIKYDEQLWDKLGNSPLTPGGVSPISVSIGHEKSSDNYLLGQYSAEVNVAKVTSGDRVMGNGCNYIKRNWYVDYWDADYSYYGYKDDLVALYVYTNNINRLCINKYYKRVIIEISIPYCDIDGTRYYLDYDIDRTSFKWTANGDLKAKVLETTQSSIKFCVDGYYSVDDTPIYAYFKWPSNLKTSREKVEFNGGSTTYKVISNANTEVIGFKQSIGKIVLDTRLYENVSIYSEKQDVTIKKTPDNSVNRLGAIYINNLGTGNSTEKKLDIKFHEKQLVTSMRLPADTVSREFDVQYTLKDENGSKVELGGRQSWNLSLKNDNYNQHDLVDNIQVIFTRNMLPEQHRTYYIDSISYTIKSIKKRSYLFYEGDKKNGNECAGHIYGKLASSAKSGEQLCGKITITSPKDSGIGEMQYNIVSNVTSEESASYGIINAKFSKASIKAGEAVYTTGSLWVSQLFYKASCTWLHNMRFALLLPKGVAIDKKSIDVRTNIGDKKVNVTNVTTRAIDDYNTLWIIDLDKDVYIGYFNEDLGVISNAGDRLNYSIRLMTDSNMEAVSLKTDEMLYLAGTDMENMVEVCFINFRTQDKWDLNNNGSSKDYIGCVEFGYRQTCSIEANNLGLAINDKISILGEGTVDMNDATIKHKNDIIQYDLSIKSIKDGTASSFEYYIPIVKKTSIQDNYLVTSDAKEFFDMQLIEEASMIGDDIYKIEYMTKEGLSYEEVRKQEDKEWYTVKELNDNNLTLKDVTFVKITVVGGTIEKGMDTNISLKIMCQGDKLYLDNGRYNGWKACGYYDFDDGKKVVSGHFSTMGVSATLDVEEPPINNIVISTGEKVNDDRVFYLYDVKGYKESVMSEPVEFMVERNSDSDVVTFAVCSSRDNTKKDKYIDHQLIKICDEHANIVEPTSEKTYILKANKKYTMSISKNAFQDEKKSKEYMFLHSIDDSISDMKRVVLIRRSAFVQK